MIRPGGGLELSAILILAAALVIWFLLSAAAGVYAGRLGRTRLGWFFISLFLSPVIAIVFLLALGHHEAQHCPYCAEPIREEAVRCPHCRSEIGENDAQGPHPLDRRWDDRRR